MHGNTLRLRHQFAFLGDIIQMSIDRTPGIGNRGINRVTREIAAVMSGTNPEKLPLSA
jgi:hypothetical protein